jgi:hypothetical protein
MSADETSLRRLRVLPVGEGPKRGQTFRSGC